MGSAVPERGGGVLEARAVMRRYGWGKTKGFQSLNNRDLVAIADQDIVDAAGAALTRESELACIGPACDARVERGHLVVRAGAAHKPRLATSGPTPRDGQADRTTSSPIGDPLRDDSGWSYLPGERRRGGFVLR